MNKLIYNIRVWFSKSFPKLIKWIIENKKLIYIWYFLVVGILFVIPFCLYLVSGIGIHFNDLEGAGSAPGFNGVWFLDDYVGNSDKKLLDEYVSSWESLQTIFTKTGFQNSNQYANLAYQFYLMNNAVLPIWVASLVLIIFPILIWALFKYLINPWVKKNLEIINNSDNINNN